MGSQVAYEVGSGRQFVGRNEDLAVAMGEGKEQERSPRGETLARTTHRTYITVQL
jgi:hypothetical protein